MSLGATIIITTSMALSQAPKVLASSCVPPPPSKTSAPPRRAKSVVSAKPRFVHLPSIQLEKCLIVLTSASRIQCSGTRPSCERCIARGHACVYVDDPKRVRRSTSNTSLCHRSNHVQSRSVSRRASYQSILAESALDDVHCLSPCSPVLSALRLDPDPQPNFSTALELNHEDSYDGEFSSAIQLSESPCMLSVQSAPPDPSSSTSFHSPQPMRYPQLEPLLSISIPGTNEVPALESTSSSPASTSSQSTPLLDYSGMIDQAFVAGEFGYDR